ncbi:hypothetical protein CHS0354_028319, partial [Potamilus streckersoni]
MYQTSLAQHVRKKSPTAKISKYSTIISTLTANEMQAGVVTTITTKAATTVSGR